MTTSSATIAINRLATLVVTFLLGLAAVVVAATPAQAYSFSREGAVNYVNTRFNGYNGAYLNLNSRGGDCTNFVSQAWHSGGKIPFDSSGADQWYHFATPGPRGVWVWSLTKTFVRVADFRSYWYTYGSYYKHVEGATNLAKPYSPALEGDAYVYDSGGNPNAPDWIHANVDVGWWTGHDMYGQHSPGKTNTDWRNWYWTRSSSERGNFVKAGHGIRVIAP